MCLIHSSPPLAVLLFLKEYTVQYSPRFLFKLLILYIYDISLSVFKLVNLRLYADNTVFFCNRKNLFTIQKKNSNSTLLYHLFRRLLGLPFHILILTYFSPLFLSPSKSTKYFFLSHPKSSKKTSLNPNFYSL